MAQNGGGNVVKHVDEAIDLGNYFIKVVKKETAISLKYNE